ncbi:MAG: DUF4097 family beta strand repeat protein [Clostridiales bacterium]|nr:DUF4097 family beta strand repeat protein [Clostridiales bacterium]
MKKFKIWHLALIALAVFIIFGAIVATIAVNNKDLHNPSSWSVKWLNRSWDFGFNSAPGKDYDINSAKTIEIGKQSKISISAISASINVYQTDGDTLEANLYGDYTSRNGEIELEVTNSGSTAKIFVKYPKNSSVSRSDLTLDVHIPKSFFKDLTVGGVSSKVVFDCDDIMFEDITITNVSGTTVTDTLHANSLSVGTVSGDVSGHFSDGSVDVDGVSSDVNLTGISFPIKVDVVSGDVTLDVEKIEDINIGTVSGSVKLTLVKNDNFYVRYDSLSGNFRCDTPLTIVRQKGGDFEGHTGDKNAPEIEIDSVSGSLTIIN